jgi:hypothetical protein
MPGTSRLACEPGSTSDVLAATHVFQVEVCSLNGLPWERGPVGQKRILELTLRLGKVFKGRLAIGHGEAFVLKVDQHRIDRHTVEDVPGAWSHFTTTPGTAYLVLASGSSDQPSELMKNGAGLIDPGQGGDVGLAEEAEGVTQPGASATEVFRAQLRFARAHLSELHDLYARYLWARVRPAISKRPSARLPQVLSLVISEKGSLLFRSELLSSLSWGEPDELTPQARIRLARGHVEILLQEDSNPMHRGLILFELPHFLQIENRPVCDVVPARRDRERFREAIAAAVDNPGESRDLLDWLDGGRRTRSRS